MPPELQSILVFVLRWFHFLAGVTWIGILYYFNFVQTPFFGKADAAVKTGMIRGLVPNALWWFRWGAMYTLITGVLVLGLRLHETKSITTPYMALVLVGGVIGICMWFNVWFVIWPNQKVVIASAEQVAAGGQPIPDAAARGARAGLASRANVVFSIPMLMFMGGMNMASAFRLSKDPYAFWAIAAVVILVLELAALKLNPNPLPKPYSSPGKAIHFGFLVAIVLAAAAYLTMR